MASVKETMNCIGLDTSVPVSILWGLFGFFRARVPKDPEANVTARVSLLDLVKSLQGRHIHLNIIRVGIDKFTDDPNADHDEIDKIDYAIYKLRNIFKQVDLGVGRVQHWDVPTADANGREDIGDEAEARALWAEWSVPNDGIDMFMVHNISAGFVGYSPIDGACIKDSGRDGALGGEVNRDPDGIARTFAHEVGHYLGLAHNHADNNCPGDDPGKNNLMAQTRCAISVRDSVLLNDQQGNVMRSHCFVKDGC